MGAPGATRLVLNEVIKKSQRERYAKLAVERKKSQLKLNTIARASIKLESILFRCIVYCGWWMVLQQK